jgi:hypothetical protein
VFIIQSAIKVYKFIAYVKNPHTIFYSLAILCHSSGHSLYYELHLQTVLSHTQLLPAKIGECPSLISYYLYKAGWQFPFSSV